MSTPGSLQSDERDTIDHLLEVIESNRKKRCDEQYKQARAQAREIVGKAYARGRIRLGRHVSELRQKYRVQTSFAHARNQTLMRQQHQHADRSILDIAWPMLHEAMQDLWDMPETRKAWLDGAVNSAVSRLSGKHWLVEHPPDLDKDERTALKQGAGIPAATRIRFSVCRDIEAGIRIRVGDTVVDATLTGLLHDRQAVEGRLIAMIRHAMPDDE